MTKWFIDTNVLVYSKEIGDPAKRLTCEQWLSAIQSHGEPVVSPQVVNETVVQLLRRRKTSEDRNHALQFGEDLLDLCEGRLDRETQTEAFALYKRYHLSWWDSVLVASALQIGCDFLLSEDTQDGQKIGRLQIVNPFRRTPEEVLASLPRRR